MKKESKKGISLLIIVLLTQLFICILIGHVIHDLIGFSNQLFLYSLPAATICFYYNYRLFVKGYELKLWKVIAHFITLSLLICFLLFYSWSISKLVPPQLNILIASIVHLEMFKLLFKPRMQKISFYVYVFYVFATFFLVYGYTEFGMFFWMFVLTIVPLFFVNSRTRQQEIFKNGKVN